MIRLLSGLAVSLLLGAAVVQIVLWLVRRILGVGAKELLPQKAKVKGVPGWLTGVIERLFFTLLIAANVQGVPTAMMAWIGLKLATNWNHPRWKDEPAQWTVFAFTALLAGLVSMLFAYIGGWIVLGDRKFGS